MLLEKSREREKNRFRRFCGMNPIIVVIVVVAEAEVEEGEGGIVVSVVEVIVADGSGGR